MLKVRSKGAIKTLLCITCNFDGQIGDLYCRIQIWDGEEAAVYDGICQVSIN